MKLFGILAVISVTFCVAYACVCVDPGFEKRFERADAVFLAKVAAVSKNEWQLEVQRVWKGDVPKRGKLRDNFADTDCGMSFNPAIPYIVFASRLGSSDIFYTDQCSGTTWLDDDLLKRLGYGRMPE